MKKNIMIIVLSVVALLLAGTVGYLIAEKVISNKYEDGSINDDVKDKENVIIEELDLTKCLNTSNLYSNASDKIGNYGLSMSVNSNKKSITLSIDWGTFGSLSGASAWTNATEEYQIVGFNKNVVDTFVGEVGHDSKGLMLFYLMDDETVEYTPVFELKYDSQNNSYYEMNYTYEYSEDGCVTNRYFTTKGLVNGVNNVVKLYNTDSSTKSGIGNRTAIGAKADGSFYDLGEIIMRERYN